jgi:cation:H+ antiporter
MSSLGAVALLGLFAAAAVVTWVSGIQLSKATDALDRRLGLGEALGGLILLGIATSLPELAITASAAVHEHLDLAIGNLLGGIAIQTVVLAALDARGPKTRPLSFLVGSLTLVIEAATVIAVVVLAIIGTRLPPSVNVAGASPVSVAIALSWVLGLLAVNRARRHPAWRQDAAPEAKPGRASRRERHPRHEHPFSRRSTWLVAGVFALGAALTLAAGYTLEETGNALAARAGLGAGIFGGTVIAAATALPELSTGLASIRLGDYALAMSDIFGGNAFMPALFLMADLLAGRPTLPAATSSDIWLAGLGILLTVVYLVGIVIRPRRTRLRMGLDSRLVIVLYVLGILGLFAIPAS